MNNSWLFFALLAPAIYALVVFIDKYVVSKEIKDYLCMPIYSAIVGLIAGTLLWLVFGRPLLSFKDTIIVFSVGILSMFSFVAYFKAIMHDEASTINLLFQMTPVLIIILSFLFLKERLTVTQLIGFVVIFGGTLGVSLEIPKRGEEIRFTPAFFLIVLYDVLWASSAILMKFALEVNTFTKNLSYYSWGVGLGGVVLYLFVPSIRKAFLENVKKVRKRAIGLISFNEALFILGRSITYYAFSIGSVALVSVLEGTQVFYGILFGWIAMFIAPKIFKENIGRFELLKKILSATILFFGIWLVS